MTSDVAISEIDKILAPVAEIEGVLAATLVELATGLVLACVRAGISDDPAVIAACAGDVMILLGDLAARTDLDDGNGELESVVVTMGGRYHLFRMIRGLAPDLVALVVTLDRAEANLAMALREIRELGEGFGA